MNNKYTLIRLVESGSVECVKLLLEAVADVNAKDGLGSALCHAVYNDYWEDNTEMIKFLIGAGAEIDSLSLKTAVSESIERDLGTLLKEGADVNGTDNEGNTVLFMSPIRFSDRRLNCYKLLLQEPIKVNVTNNHGFNALTHLLNDYCMHRPDGCLLDEFAMLLFAAGETPDKTIVRVPEYLKPSTEIGLKNICREAIRKHLLEVSNVNLFVRVPQLPLPRLMTSYLLYNVTLDQTSVRPPALVPLADV